MKETCGNPTCKGMGKPCGKDEPTLTLKLGILINQTNSWESGFKSEPNDIFKFSTRHGSVKLTPQEWENSYQFELINW